EHSAVQARKVSLDLNYDSLAPLGDPEEVEVSGAERTTFYSTVEEKAKTLGITILPDARPEAGYYSDDFSFARVGIPSFSISEGLKFKGHDAAWGEAQERNYLEHGYHQPTDEYAAAMDFTGDAKLAMFGYELGVQAASQAKVVGWLPGDEFEAERKRNQALNQRPPQPPPRRFKPRRR